MNQVHQGVQPPQALNDKPSEALLVVDDAKVNRETLARRLSLEGYQVVTAEGGRQALSMVAQGGVGLVLLDLEMPDMDGMEVLGQLRAQFTELELPVLMVSGNTESPQMVSALDRGANDYLTKPVDFQLLLAKVRRHLNLRSGNSLSRSLEVSSGDVAPPNGQPISGFLEVEAESDRCEFDPRLGPPPPNWTPWPLEQREFVENLLQKHKSSATTPRPDLWMDMLRPFLADKRSGYLLLEGPAGCGKSLLGTHLESCAAQLSNRPLRYAYLRVPSSADGEMFVELVNDSLSLSRTLRAQRVVPLDPSALRELSLHCPIVDEGEGRGRSQRFTAYLQSLSRLNRGTVVIYLDELELGPEDAFDFLPDNLPDGLFLIIPYTTASGRFRARLDALLSAGAQRHPMDIRSVAYQQFLASELSRLPAFRQDENLLRQVIRRGDAVLFTCQVAAEALQSGLLAMENLPSPPGAEQQLLQQVFASLHNLAGGQGLLKLYLALSANPEPVALESLYEWGISPQALTKAIEVVPTTLLVEQRGLSLSIAPGQASVAQFLKVAFRTEFCALCRRLCAWQVHQIRGASPLNLDSESSRQWALLALSRLYRWAIACGDMDVLDWVVANTEMAEARAALAASLEGSGKAHLTLAFLDLWVEALVTMVETFMAADLRDKLAQALNVRARGYLACGCIARARADVDRAVAIFEVLVESERKTQFRSGLASAYNGRGKLLSVVGQHLKALVDLNKAVEMFRLLTDDFGRDELREGLAESHRNRAVALAALGNPREALLSGREALKQYHALEQLGMGQEGKHLVDQGQTELLVARLHLELNQPEESGAAAGRAIDSLRQLVEIHRREDMRADLARAHFVSAKCYFARGHLEAAGKDIGKSVQFFNELLDQGRRDILEDMSNSYAERAQIFLAAGQPGEALRALSKGLEIRAEIMAGGNPAQALPYARMLLTRARLYRTEQQLDLAVGDYDKAAAILEKQTAHPESYEVYLERAGCHLRRGNYEQCSADAQRVVGQLLIDPLVQARAYSLIGLADTNRLRLGPAREALGRAGEIFFQSVQQNPTAELLGELAACYIDLSQVELRQNHVEQAVEQSGRAVDALTVLVQQSPTAEVKANLAQALSCRGEALGRMKLWGRSAADLQKALEMLTYMVDTQRLEVHTDKLALAQRRWGQLLLDTNNASAALKAVEHSDQLYQTLWNKDRSGPWLDELCRTYRLRSGISMSLKEYGRAEEELSRAFEHFNTLVSGGRTEYIDDVLRCHGQRAANYQLAASPARAVEEYLKQAQLCKKLMLENPGLDLRAELAQASYQQALLAVEQRANEQAFNCFGQAIQIYRGLVIDEARIDLAPALADSYSERGQMLLGAGHYPIANDDLTQAVKVLQVLVQQGRVESGRKLAQVAALRALVWQHQGSPNQAMEDLNLALDLLMRMAASDTAGDSFPDLARALTQRGKLWLQFQQAPQAAEDYANALQLYTRLVDVQGRSELSSELAECLLAHLSLSHDPKNPANQAALARAVKLVLQQVKEGRAPPPGFVFDGLQTVSAMLASDPALESADMTESVLKLVEAVAVNPRIELDWVPITELLTESASRLDPVRHSKYMHLITLACLTCQREVTVHGAPSLGRLVYYCHQVGLGMEMSRSLPECVGSIGTCFTTLLNNLSALSTPAMQNSLREMVIFWRNLPPTLPANANIPRQVLTALARSL